MCLLKLPSPFCSPFLYSGPSWLQRTMIFGEKGKKERLGRSGGRVRGGVKFAYSGICFSWNQTGFLVSLHHSSFYFVFNKMTPIWCRHKGICWIRNILFLFFFILSVVLNPTTVLIYLCFNQGNEKMLVKHFNTVFPHHCLWKESMTLSIECVCWFQPIELSVIVEMY